MREIITMGDLWVCNPMFWIVADFFALVAWEDVFIKPISEMLMKRIFSKKTYLAL